MTEIDTARSTFSALLGELEAMAHAAFRHLPPLDREEEVANTIALCWKGYAALVRQGRGDEPNIIKSCLWYSIRQTKAGRTVWRASNARAKDVLDHAERGGVRFEWVDPHHFVGDDTPVPDAVAFRIDVPAFLASLSDRQREIALDLMSGLGTGEVARRQRITAGAVSQTRNRIKELYDVFMAE